MGYVAFERHLLGSSESDEERQRRRTEVLETSAEDVRRFGDALGAAVAAGQSGVAIVGSQEAFDAAKSVEKWDLHSVL